jgi:gamma-glutamyltranspeptidase/glutathione hydrolase
MPFGLAALHERWGTVPLSDLARPAIRACTEGVTVTAGFAEVARLLWPIQCVTPGMRSLFDRRGASLQQHDRFVNPGLAGTLELFAAQGEAAFRSHGLLGSEILRCFPGSALTARDLDTYQARRVEPLRVPRGQHEVLLPPRPSAGGTMTATALQAFSYGPAPFTAAHVRELARTMSLAEAREPPLSAGFTTHLGAVDQHGNACTITSSLGETCGHLVPHAGLSLNNFLGETDCNPPQAPTPAGERLRTMMTPTVLRGPSSIHTLGSGGSSRIRSAVLHGLLHLVDHGLHPREAACGPRCHMELGQLRVEAYERPEPDFLDRLADFPGLVSFDGPNMYFGGLHIAGRADGAFEGAGDERRSGAFGILGASLP